MQEELWIYKGEVGINGRAYGFGSAISVDNPDKKYTGTFADGLIHGLGESKFMLNMFA